MPPRRYLLADNIHLHERNFKPLFRHIQARKIACDVHVDYENLKRRLGNYDEVLPVQSYRARLEGLDLETLRAYTHPFHNMPLRVFPLCRAEALAYALATREHWQDELVPCDEEAVFSRLAERDRDVLLGNMAAAAFWIDAFAAYLAKQNPPYTHAFIFSGSMTYSRVLMEILRFYRTKVIVLESLFTGREFYFEERYYPIANYSDIRLPTVRSAIRQPDSAIERARDQVKAVERVFRARNKNVQQPEDADIPNFAPDTKTLLVVGQVANDFSIIEQRRGTVSSIAFYKQLIGRVLAETDYNVVFKGHPWEEKKTHLERPFTRESLERFRASLPDAWGRRFAIRDHDNLRLLGERADRVALLNSQAGIELAFYCGLRPSVFGDPFYGQAGFTDEFASIDAFLQHIKGATTGGLLDLEGYSALLSFLTLFLEHHAVTDRPIGLKQIEQKLSERSTIDSLGAVPRPLIGPATIAKTDVHQVLGHPWDILYRKGRKLIRSPRAFVRDAKVVRAFQRNAMRIYGRKQPNIR